MGGARRSATERGERRGGCARVGLAGLAGPSDRGSCQPARVGRRLAGLARCAREEKREAGPAGRKGLRAKNEEGEGRKRISFFQIHFQKHFQIDFEFI